MVENIKEVFIEKQVYLEDLNVRGFADLIITAPTARPMAATNPKISPKKFPNFIES